ncbi:GNAT family protein [Acinetobacter sp. MD2(2019)]|uniref:GNAT family N-acetyltransferase n=1 Tax=Acinetobacter sp. MD2(2019) TaxID=2605273 RepID=UPI002D1E4FD5|nr:GNAT family protein [Acinetobacter sp. MD2(2019)]MEB3754016.1 GNAT family N-acetyltransferase [Acinetobacter sp. MD2(2019)]
MNFVVPVSLSYHQVRLEPLSQQHAEGLKSACRDGELWKLRVTSAPSPETVSAYIDLALAQREQGTRFAFVVIDERTETIVGTTSYHDIVAPIKRLEIGYTWYAKSAQRTHINTTCKLLLLRHAFEQLHANVVGLRTDHFNFASQRAIERLGAKKDGVLRQHAARPDGTIRDTVMYSIIQSEWAGVQAHLLYLLDRSSLAKE